MSNETPDTIQRVRYIKLGAGGKWETACVEQGINRMGFDTRNPEAFRLCESGRWNELRESYIAEGRHKGTATRFANEIRLFFEDDGSILWITFVGERLFWGRSDQTKAVPSPEFDGACRTMRDGWQSTALDGDPLTKDRLSGALTQLTAYRGTSCDVDLDVSHYIIRRINGQRVPEVERAIAASEEMKSSVLGLMRLLDPRDFELLVDLVFSTSGWRRLGSVGGTEKTRDLDLILPTTQERAFVQVKSKTTSVELAEYVTQMDHGYDRMFYVFHSGEAQTKDERVTVIGPEQLARMVFDAGLVGWLIRKVS